MNQVISVKNVLLAGLAVSGAFVVEQLGGWDAMLGLLMGFMAADVVTGVLVAAIWKKSGKTQGGRLESRAGFKGLCRKGIILLLIWLGVLMDEALGTAYIRSAIILFFVGNEGLSLLENLGLMGVQYPAALKNALEVLRDKGENGHE